MKRSEINREIKQAIKQFDHIGFKLPPFAFWRVEDWRQKGDEVSEIIENRLGWDITDFGCNRFDTMGLILFTIRNGNLSKMDRFPKTYAEKIMIINDGQTAPMHFHWNKCEDIINRGGGDLVIQVYMATENETLSDKDFSISVDGLSKTVKAGEEIILTPGESVCLVPFVYHSFHARTGTGPVIIGEVSQVNDDECDNRFLEPIGRFPEIEEDEAPLHLLCNEYNLWRSLSPS